jgi:D-arabinose 1-dehydrogenase-like Zn-dependent alcohol dehydrogenase
MQNSVTDTVRTPQPKILVLGATGGTGHLIVSQALARNYDVTVLSRSAEKASGLEGAKRIVGDARDETVLRQALEGRDAVISALGLSCPHARDLSALGPGSILLCMGLFSIFVFRGPKRVRSGLGRLSKH